MMFLSYEGLFPPKTRYKLPVFPPEAPRSLIQVITTGLRGFRLVRALDSILNQAFLPIHMLEKEGHAFKNTTIVAGTFNFISSTPESKNKLISKVRVLNCITTELI